MNIETLLIHKETIKSIIMFLGDPPASRHLSIARTELENAVLRIDCEVRSQGITEQDIVKPEKKKSGRPSKAKKAPEADGLGDGDDIVREVEEKAAYEQQVKEALEGTQLDLNL